ncbi:MAG: cobalamin-dependent protein [Nitrospinae bacterium]|nr:cobalamin-dependent protein [Nitrospinota bacterium]
MTDDTIATRLKELASLVQHGENVQAVSLSGKLLDEQVPVVQIVDSLSAGLAVLRDKCTLENFQLLDVLLASRAMIEVVDECVARHLEKAMDRAASAHEASVGVPAAQTLVIGAIEGDVHDLGTHIMGTLCRFNNIRVVNLGKDVPVERFVEAALREEADFVGVSSLMTICLGKVKEIRPLLHKRGLGHVKVIGGGAAVVQSAAEALALDYKAMDAFDGLGYLTRFALRATEQLP